MVTPAGAGRSGDTGVGGSPVAKGDPETAVSEVELMENTETLFEPWLATTRKCPAASIAMAMGSVPVAADPLAVDKDPLEFTV